MTPDYVRNIRRLAIVGDARWHDWVAQLSSTFAAAEHFEPTELDRAWR